MKNLIFLISVLVGFIPVFQSCKKPGPAANNQSFLRTLPNPSDQTAYFLQHTSDGGFLLVADGQKNPVSWVDDLSIYKLDGYGNLVWKKTFPDSVRYPKITPLPDGGFLLGSGDGYGQLFRFSKDGEVILHNFFYPFGGFLWAPPVLAPSGKMYVSLSDGPTQAGPSNNVLQEFGTDGSTGPYYFLDDTAFHAKIADLVNYRVDANENFWFYGRMYLNPFSWSNNARLYVSIWQMKSNNLKHIKSKVLDSANDNFSNMINATESTMHHVVTDKNELVFTLSQKSKNNIYRGYVSKVDESLNELWNLPLNIGSFGTQIHSISENRDGSYLITGNCISAGNSFGQPMACRVSQDGKLLWSKIFSTTYTGILRYGFETKDGFYAFCGQTNSFGVGSNGNDLIIIKTDKDGNIK